MSEMSVIRKWFEIASDHLRVAVNTFENMQPKQIDISCYQTQQTVEKTLKGFLLYNNIEAPETHNLVMLCQLCVEEYVAFSELMDSCAELTPYGLITQYPNDIIISEEKAKIALIKAKEIYEFGISLIPELSTLKQETLELLDGKMDS